MYTQQNIAYFPCGPFSLCDFQDGCHRLHITTYVLFKCLNGILPFSNTCAGARTVISLGSSVFFQTSCILCISFLCNILTGIPDSALRTHFLQYSSLHLAPSCVWMNAHKHPYQSGAYICGTLWISCLHSLTILQSISLSAMIVVWLCIVFLYPPTDMHSVGFLAHLFNNAILPSLCTHFSSLSFIPDPFVSVFLSFFCVSNSAITLGAWVQCLVSIWMHLWPTPGMEVYLHIFLRTARFGQVAARRNWAPSNLLACSSFLFSHVLFSRASHMSISGPIYLLASRTSSPFLVF